MHIVLFTSIKAVLQKHLGRSLYTLATRTLSISNREQFGQGEVGIPILRGSSFCSESAGINNETNWSCERRSEKMIQCKSKVQ